MKVRLVPLVDSHVDGTADVISLCTRIIGQGTVSSVQGGGGEGLCDVHLSKQYI